MFTSQRFRRSVVLPLTEDSRQQLEKEDIDDALQVTSLEFPEAVYDNLWKKGFFTSINDLCDLLISDYETEIIEFEHLECVVDALKLSASQERYLDYLSFLFNFQAICEEALELRMPVYLIF